MVRKAEFVIVDTLRPMTVFLKRTDFYNTHGIDISRDHLDEYLDSILDQVMDAIYHEGSAQSKLWDYAVRLKESCVQCDQRAEGVMLAKAVIELGESIQQNLRDMGAYNTCHNLGYYFSGRLNKMDLILTKFTGDY